MESRMQNPLYARMHIARKTGLPDNAVAHYHPFHELCFFQHSSVRAFLQGSWRDVKDGDIIWVPRHIMHRFEYPKGTRYTRLLIELDDRLLRDLLRGMGCEDMMADAGLETCRHIHPEPAQFRRLLSLAEETLSAWESWRLRQDHVEEAHMQARLFCLMYGLRPALGQHQADAAADVPACVAETVAWIDRHYGENITLDLLAGMCHVDKYHLCHLFVRHTGISVMKYVQHRRGIEAEKLLTYTDLPLDVVAGHAGFHSMQHFYRVFRELTNTTPGRLSRLALAAGKDSPDAQP